MCPRSLSTGADKRSATVSRLWLLLIGVDRYEDERLPSLRYCAADCQGLADALMDATRETADRRLFVHHDFSGESPSAKQVTQSLGTVVEEARPGDRVIFYFCGHGALDRTNGRAVLCLSDTHREHLATTGLDLVDLVEQLSRCAARERFVLLDACHSGALTVAGGSAVNPLDSGGQIFEVLRDYASRSKGFYAMLSCQENERSWEFDTLRHGVFTHFLMRGLRGEAANPCGAIDIDDLYRYVYHRTLHYIDNINQQIRLLNLQKIQRGEVELLGEYPLQTPKRIVSLAGEVAIGTRPNLPPEQSRRRALVLAGRPGGTAALALGRLLGSVGGFELTYWPQPGHPWSEAHQAVRDCLGDFAPGPAVRGTLFLYLQGRIEVDSQGETWLVLSDEFRLSPSWLRRRLRQAAGAQQIVVLDCPQTEALGAWVEDLTLGGEAGQCLVAAASPANAPEQFARTLVEILAEADPQNGLTAARCIAQLQVRLVNSGVALHPVLIGGPGVIDVLPQASARSGAVAGDLNLCPYMGLRAFGENDAAYYFGREGLVDDLLQRLARESFLAVVGASGSGKSSLVQAGLLARLRQGRQIPGSERWWLGVIRPGIEPIKALCRRLTTSDEEAGVLEGQMYLGPESFVHWLRGRGEPMVLLVIDQFEELFTLTPARERQEFLDLLLGAIHYAGDRFKLVITLRFDFAEACLEVPALEALLRTCTQFVSPLLSEEDYRRVICEPARLVNLQVEPELTEVLLQELSHSAGDLPLLEFVLEQLWDLRVRSEGRLTLAAYQQQIGGLRGALEHKAQSVYETLDPEARQCAQWLFLSLTQLGEGKEDTRRRVLRSELVVERYPADLVDRTLSTLTAAKLVVVGRDETPDSGRSREGSAAEVETMLAQLKREVTVEVAHEILIRYWSTLRSWLDDNRKRLRIQREIEQATALWKQKGEDPDSVLQGLRLAEAEALYGKYADELSPEVRRFIETCFQKREKLKAQEKQRLRRAQIVASVMGVLGVMALGFAGLAYWQTGKAQQNAVESKLHEIEALNSSAEGLFLADRQLEALTASVRATRLLSRLPAHPSALVARTEGTLQRNIYLIQEVNRLEGSEGWMSDATFSPDGTRILASGRDLYIWGSDGTLLKTLSGHKNWVYSVAYSPDGRLIASASPDRTIKVWDGQTGRLLRTIEAHADVVFSVNFSPDGQKLVSAHRDGTVRLWNTAKGTLIKTLRASSKSIYIARFSPDGRLLASAGRDGTIVLWDGVHGQLLRTFRGHNDVVHDISFSPDGQVLASASYDHTVRLWKLDGTLLQILDGHKALVSAVGFSPDGKMLASAGDDNSIKLWNPADGSLLTTLKGHSNGVTSVAFSPDGKRLVSASEDRSVRIWRLENRFLKQLQGHSADVYGVAYSPDGTVIATAGEDRVIRLWESATGRWIKTLAGHLGTINSLAFNSNGTLLVSASNDRTVRVWSLANGRQQLVLSGHKYGVNSAAFSPDDTLIATGSSDRTIKLWEAKGGRLVATLTGHNDKVAAVTFAPDGRLLASGSLDKTVRLWSVPQGKLLRTLRGHGGDVFSVAFAPDGRLLASGSLDKTVRLWSVPQGELLQTLRGHSDGVNSVTFSPDGKRLASGSSDRTLRLWRTANGTLQTTLQGHDGWVNSTAFSPDGKRLISVGTNREAFLWLHSELPSSFLETGCQLLKDYLAHNPNVRPPDRVLCSDRF